MKLVSLSALALGIVTIGLAQTASPQQTKPEPTKPEQTKESTRATLKAQVSRQQYHVNTPIVVMLTLLNTSTGNVTFGPTTPDWDYQVVMKNAEGKELGRTFRGSLVANPGKEMRTPSGALVISSPPGGGRSENLAPGDQHRVNFDLGEIYALINPGVYYVQFRRFVDPEDFKAGVKEVVFSNLLEIELVP